MKNHTKVQDSLLTQDSNDFSTSDTITFTESIDSHKLFSFGSTGLAVIYMANTMVIPSMNQLQSEIDFTNAQSIAYTVTAYWLLMLVILFPCYLVISICKEHGNPFFSTIIQKNSEVLFKMFIYSNLIINGLGLFSIIVRLGENLPKMFPSVYLLYSETLTSSSPYSYLAFFANFSLILLIFAAVYKVSYFEHYYDIQYRLIISFGGKLIIQLTIFFIIITKDVSECTYDYLSSDTNLLAHGYTFNSIMFYILNVVSCVSYPFFEVFYVKRETRAGYTKVQQCYKFQLLFRCFYFSQQVVIWGLITHYDKINCFYSPVMQGLNVLLILLVTLSISPIYAHNYTLSKQILKGAVLEANEQENKKEMNEIYTLTVLYFIIYNLIVLITKICGGDFLQVKDKLLDQSFAIQAFCFGFSCICVPIYIYLNNYLGKVLLGALMAAFTLVCLQPSYSNLI